MKRVKIPSSILIVMTILLVAAAAPVANFSGTWVLDKARSQGLPGPLQNASRVVLIVKHAGGSLNITNKLTIGGQEKTAWERTYRLDGKQTTSSLGPEVQGSATHVGKSIKAGNALDLTTTRTFDSQGREVTITNHDVWEVADGGKTLKITGTTQSPQGTLKNLLFFTRQ